MKNYRVQDIKCCASCKNYCIDFSDLGLFTMCLKKSGKGKRFPEVKWNGICEDYQGGERWRQY